MILTPEVRSQFTVFAFFQDLEVGSQIRTALAMDGYESFAFMDYETCLERIRQASPHLVVFNLEALMGTLSEFVEKVLEINPEINFLPVVDPSQASALEAYREYNFQGVLTTGADLSVRAKWAVDQICSELYLTYQNEQLVKDEQHKIELTEAQERKLVETERNLKALEKRLADQSPPFLIRDSMTSYTALASKEDLIMAFLQRLGKLFADIDLHGLYLKYLPSVHQLVAAQTLGLPLDQIKGVGAKLRSEEIPDLHLRLARNEAPESVQKLMEQGFHVKTYAARGLLVHRGIEGVFLFWSKKGVDLDLLDNEFLVFSQSYASFDLARKFDAINFEDHVTEAYNREYYFMKLEEEVARARRLQKAVSVIKVAFDDWEGIQREGSVVRDAALRALVILIKKSSRVNDLTCRTLENEISLILPHSARKGAAIRAERLRRMIESHVFQYLDRPLTISCGISEYPSFCASASELDHSAAQALTYIRARGGNKVCLFRPSSQFKPDFDVAPI